MTEFCPATDSIECCRCAKKFATPGDRFDAAKHVDAFKGNIFRIQCNAILNVCGECLEKSTQQDAERVRCLCCGLLVENYEMLKQNRTIASHAREFVQHYALMAQVGSCMGEDIASSVNQCGECKQKVHFLTQHVVKDCMSLVHACIDCAHQKQLSCGACKADVQGRVLPVAKLPAIAKENKKRKVEHKDVKAKKTGKVVSSVKVVCAQ